MQPDCLQHFGLDDVTVQDGTCASLYGGDVALPGDGETRTVTSPVDGAALATFRQATAGQVDIVARQAHTAFLQWRSVPAPVRGELVRRIGNIAREHKPELAEIITLEAGKIRAEALGEVQEWIDICDFATGLSRQLGGLTIPSERPGHRMMEQWHPLGPVAVISAFNFPVAVWSWNAMLALVCGDTLVWKPAEQTPLCALACQHVIHRALEQMPGLPRGVSSVVVGDRDCGQALAADGRFPLVSATGSCAMGRAVGTTVAARLGRSLLELGGNNAMIVTADADLELALRAMVFSAVGTAGQRCTSLRRVIAHESILPELSGRLLAAYDSLVIGDPRNEGVLVGPLVNENSYSSMQSALEKATDQGGEILHGGDRITQGVPAAGFYVRPAIVRIPRDADIIRQETFAPVLYLIAYSTLAEAIEIHNNVPQGLSSAIFTDDLREAEYFLSAAGSDCGIANVNIGTSGAEIGAAFGGEKDTGGGRESGSDAWKNYMRRATNTVNYSSDLPLAQGIVFE